MTTKLKMPLRQPGDGPVGVDRYDDNYLCIRCGQQDFVVSQFNACRLLGMLSFMLGMPLSKEAQKAIVL